MSQGAEVMTTQRRFPVIHDNRFDPKSLKVPRSVPWEFVEAFRSYAESNHAQTLEVLASRGGMTPVEIFAAAHCMSVRYILSGTIDKMEAAEWLVAEVAKRAT